MPKYRGVSQDTGAEVIKSNTSYRAVLDTARSLAQREVGNVVIKNADDGTDVMIVWPDGSTHSPNRHRR